MVSRRSRALRSQRIVLVAFDLLAVFLAFSVGHSLVRALHPYGHFMASLGSLHLVWLVPIGLTWLGVAWFHGLYRETTYRGRLGQTSAIFSTVLLGTLAPFVYGHVARTGVFVERGYVPLVIGFLAFLLFMLLRLVVFRAIHRTMVRRGYWASRVLVVGRGEVGEKVSKWMSESDQSSLRFAGFVHFKSGEERPARGLVESAVKQRQADEVIVAVPDLSHQEMLEIKDCCGDGGIRVSFVSNLFKTLCEKVDLSRIEGVPLLELKNGKRGMLGLAAKRLLDLGASTFLILFLSPLLLAFGLIIRHTSPGPAMFRQRRIGLNGRTFTLYKFRTMYDKADSGDNIHKHFVSELIRDGSRERPSYKIVEDPRVTRIGRWLRRTSLDELLQIFNVFKGDMSLVGPRPALPYELESYQKWHRKRLTVRPGITGLWQVAGRSGVPFDEMVLMDVYYIENWSLWMDMSLVLKTIPAVLSGRGAY